MPTLRHTILMRASAARRQERLAVENCCDACKEAAETTGQRGFTPFDGPFVGRPIGKLVQGDVIRSFGGDGPHVLGDVSVYSYGVTVVWRDRTERESLTGAIALCVLRTEELPTVRGAGLMPINGELVEMV